MWQHVKLSEQIRPWDTLACCWDVKQPTNKQSLSLLPFFPLCLSLSLTVSHFYPLVFKPHRSRTQIKVTDVFKYTNKQNKQNLEQHAKLLSVPSLPLKVFVHAQTICMAYCALFQHILKEVWLCFSSLVYIKKYLINQFSKQNLAITCTFVTGMDFGVQHFHRSDQD